MGDIHNSTLWVGIRLAWRTMRPFPKVKYINPPCAVGWNTTSTTMALFGVPCRAIYLDPGCCLEAANYYQALKQEVEERVP